MDGCAKQPCVKMLGVFTSGHQFKKDIDKPEVIQSKDLEGTKSILVAVYIYFVLFFSDLHPNAHLAP